ncbi:MAG: phosphatidate cytidylyltransferase [Actinomycetota bacterium]
MTTTPPSRSERRAAGEPPGTRPSRAGRNLPTATAVGVSLGAVVLASLIFRKEGFLAVLIVAACFGVWELRGGLAQGKINVPLLPSLVGAVAMITASFYGGGQALTVCFGLTCISMLLWRVADGLHDAVRDIAGGIFVAAYVPLLASFASLMLAERDGAKRVLVFLIVGICSDVGGYAVGVVAGKHPMAPSISPKKSWEGAAGSALACVVAGIATVTLIMDGTWWAGAIVGLALVVSATLGDLTESTIKRDLGIKDLGTILPGHGGIMDRMDSLLLSAPVAWALLALLVPVAVGPVA